MKYIVAQLLMASFCFAQPGPEHAGGPRRAPEPLNRIELKLMQKLLIYLEETTEVNPQLLQEMGLPTVSPVHGKVLDDKISQLIYANDPVKDRLVVKFFADQMLNNAVLHIVLNLFEEDPNLRDTPMEVAEKVCARVVVIESATDFEFVRDQALRRAISQEMVAFMKPKELYKARVLKVYNEIMGFMNMNMFVRMAKLTALAKALEHFDPK